MTLGIGIITVAERLDRATTLAIAVKPPAQEGPAVSVDYDRVGPWWNFRRTAQLLLEQGHSHVLVLEDDVTLCESFLVELQRVIAIVPSDPLSLFTARRSIVKEADEKHTRLLKRYALDTAQGLVFPAFMFEALCKWVDANEAEHPEWSFHGDVRIGAWSKARRWPIVHVIPNLVNHDVSIPSTLGHSGKTRYGDRVSPRFYDDMPDRDELYLDWGQPR